MNRSLLALAQVSAALGVSLACYLVSAHVNAEHGAIDRLTRTIAQERRAVTMLGGLYDARRAMPQVQRWSDADATRLMSAPAPEQMLAGATQLATFIPGRGGASATQAVLADASASASASTATSTSVPFIAPAASVAEPAPAPAPAPEPAPAPAPLAVPVAARPVMIAAQIAVPRVPAARDEAAPPPHRETRRNSAAANTTAPARADRAAAQAMIAARVPPRDTPDLAALSRDIGRELRASDASPVRRVSLR